MTAINKITRPRTALPAARSFQVPIEPHYGATYGGSYEPPAPVAVTLLGTGVIGVEHHGTTVGLPHLGYGALSFKPIESPAHEIEQVRMLLENLVMRIERLENTLNALSTESPAPREGVSDKVAKAEIKEYFDHNDGDTIFPSEVAAQLRLDYETVSRLMNELEAHGQIRKSG